MAQTYMVAEALNVVSSQLRRTIEDQQAPYLANIAQNVIWNRYDWRETLAPLPPFYLVPNSQEFGSPAVIVPSDFLGLREAYLVSTQVVPEQRMELKVRRDVRATGAQAMPSEIGYEPATHKFRVFPRTPSGIGTTDWIVDGTYKIRPPKITAANLQTTPIPWDDQYFQVYVSALKWASLDAAGDPRAGSVQLQNGQTIYTGQLGTMHDQINQMAQDEGLNLGDTNVAPSEPLVWGNWSTGGYGTFLY